MRNGDDHLEEQACQVAHSLLGQPLHLTSSLPADRWRHTVTVARRAGQLAEALGLDDIDIVSASAWLHDIGYADSLRQCGFHPVDGALYLVETGWPARVVELVAHHSGARYLAEVRGLSGMLAQWPFRNGVAMDVLTYADQTTGPTGIVVSLEERMAEVLRRRGPASAHAIAHPRRARYLRAVRDRVQAALGTDEWQRSAG